MRILIIGAGNAGRQLAAKLCDEKHDVVMIDHEPGPLTEVEAQLDILTIRGQGSNPKVLEEARIRKADMLVAVTSCDEVNILAGYFAHTAGVAHVIVRVANPAYMGNGEGYSLAPLGIDLAVSQKRECARELFRILRQPGATEVIDMLDGRVQTIGLKIHTDSPLLSAPLKEFPRRELIDKVRFIAVMRGDEVFIPDGDTRFLIGDDVYFIGQPEDVTALIHWADPEHLRFQKVVIAGGGVLGFQLAQLLEDASLKPILIESDAARAQECSAHLNKTLVIKADALAQDALADTGLDAETAFVAATGDDENNIISCLLAEKLGASFTLAQISKPEYVPIINSSSLLDRAISPHSAMINAILRFIRGRTVCAAALLQHLPGELLEIALPDDSRWIGKAIKQIKIPAGDILAAVLRKDKVQVAIGETILERGDRLLVFSMPGAFRRLEAVLGK